MDHLKKPSSRIALTGHSSRQAESENIPHTFAVYKKEEQNGTMSIVPLGTMDIGEDDAEVIFPGTQNEENDVDALERIVLNYYAQNYDALQEDDDDDDDSTDDDTD
jgi:hypothetical protein